MLSNPEFMRYLELLNTYGWLLLVFVAERLWPARKIPYLSRGWISDLFQIMDQWVRPFVIGAVIVLLVPYMSKLPGGGGLSGLPIWANFLILAVISEAVFYFTHRLMHAVPWMWEFHRVHHSSTTYYSLMTARFHVFDVVLFTAPYLLLASFLGARAEALIAFSVFQGFSDRFSHTNIRAPHFVAYYTNSPKFHSWHHSTDEAAWGKNFSRNFTFMDYLFGTVHYPSDSIAQEFGDREYPTNYFQAQLMPFWVLGKRLAGRKPRTDSAQAAPQDAVQPAEAAHGSSVRHS